MGRFRRNDQHGAWAVGLLLLFTLAPLPVVAEYQRYGHKQISFKIQAQVPQLVITLSTHSVADIPLPSLDPASIERYQAQVLAQAGNAEPNIEIAVPFRDYGFSGTINDAYISQGRGVSFDPASLFSGSGVRHVGQLTIVEFTEDVLKASFSGELYYVGENNQAIFDRNVSGSFWISFPVLNDPRVAEDFPESEDIRLKLAGMWDLLRNMGLGLDDAGLAASPGAPGSGPGAAADAAGAATLMPECACECEVLIALPEGHACIQPQGPCYHGLELCRAYGLDKAGVPASADVEAIVDRMVGANAPSALRASMRELVLGMSPEERAGLLEGYRQSGTLAPGQAPAGSAERAQLQRALTEPGPPTDSGLVAVNPAWDAETLRYKTAVEQLGLPPEILEEAVEMFHNNDAPMRAQLWRNVEAQLALKRGGGQ